MEVLLMNLLLVSQKLEKLEGEGDPPGRRRHTKLEYCSLYCT